MTKWPPQSVISSNSLDRLGPTSSQHFPWGAPPAVLPYWRYRTAHWHFIWRQGSLSNKTR